MPDLSNIDPEVIKFVPAEMARIYKIIPVKMEEGEKGTILTVAMVDPTNDMVISDIQVFSGCKTIKPIKADSKKIRAAIQKYYPPEEKPQKEDSSAHHLLLQKMFGAVMANLIPLLQDKSPEETQKMLNAIVATASKGELKVVPS